jgi:hypothetical protein
VCRSVTLPANLFSPGGLGSRHAGFIPTAGDAALQLVVKNCVSAGIRSSPIFCLGLRHEFMTLENPTWRGARSFHVVCVTVSMKASVQPVHNAFQSYLRALISDTAHQPPLRRSICAECLTTLTLRQRRSPRVSGRQLHVASRACSARYAREAVQTVQSSAQSQWQWRQKRELATVKDVRPHGPLEEYDERVHARRLRMDEHQRSE